jgi:pimeloyl-ACP methyl ester carboxylesterase
VPTATTGDGCSLAFASTGDGPPDVLFMHGWAGSGRYFDETLRHLGPARVRAVTYDLRGHGGSDRSPDDHTLDRIAADALAVADAAGLETFTIVGFSMGAKFAQYVALEAPERVRGLVLVAGCPAGEVALPAELLEDWYAREGNAAALCDVVTAYATQPIDAAVLERFGQDAATVPRAALEGTMNAATVQGFADRVGAISAPALVVGGAGDAMFPPEALRDAVVAPLPSARLASLDAGHEIPVERPQELARLIEAFLAGRGPAV